MTLSENQRVDRDIFDDHPMMVNVANGILDIDTMRLMPHTPMIPFRVKLNAKYDPKAVPTKFIKFLSEVLEDSCDRLTMLEMFASAMLRNTLNLKKAAILLGDGAGGKSTLLHAMVEFFGIGGVSFLTMHDVAASDAMAAGLDGKMLNIQWYMSSLDIARVETIKNIVGGNLTKVKRKYKMPFVMRPHAKVFFETNQLPAVKTDMDAISNLFVIVKFKRHFIGRDINTNILAELTTEEEKSGMLNLLIYHAKIVMRQGRLTYEPTPEQVRCEWNDNAEPSKRFFGECVRPQDGGSVKKADLYLAYAAFCLCHRFRQQSKKTFASWCEERGYVDGDVRPGEATSRLWNGIAIQNCDNDGATAIGASSEAGDSNSAGLNGMARQ